VLYYERKLKKKGFSLIIGVDEAGRGPLAGPVVAAAVYLPRTSFKNRIDDSKKLSPSQRESAFLEIAARAPFGVGIINEKAIDRCNILAATRYAMEDAIKSLTRKLTRILPARTHILIDGNITLSVPYPCTAIIGGDGKSLSIACASIVAKVVRDRIMCVYDRVYPGYGFSRHKGYPTARHRRALRRLGPSGIHRKSFHCA
jgi:ribonuclease HII